MEIGHWVSESWFRWQTLPYNIKNHVSTSNRYQDICLDFFVQRNTSSRLKQWPVVLVIIIHAVLVLRWQALCMWRNGVCKFPVIITFPEYNLWILSALFITMRPPLWPHEQSCKRYTQCRYINGIKNIPSYNVHAAYCISIWVYKDCFILIVPGFHATSVDATYASDM